MGSFSAPKVDFNSEKTGDSILNRSQEQARNQSQSDAGDYAMAYFNASFADPRESFGDKAEGGAYDAPYSRVGYYWKSYIDAYNDIFDATKDYRSDLNAAFDDNRQYLDTGGIQDEWQQYFDRLSGYYGNARDTTADLYGGYRDDWVDREAYDLWGNLVKGGAPGVQDWFQQTDMGEYLEGQANENFWRQSQLGGQTYNPQEVQEYISQKIVAPEMWQGLNALGEYAKMQPDLDWRITGAMGQLEQWYADAMAKGDTLKTDQIATLMNQMNQQMWQSNMNQALSDAELQYMLEGSLPASKTMDYRTAMTQMGDITMMMRLMDDKNDQGWDYFINNTLPNANESFNFESSALQQSTNAYLQMMQNQANASMIGSGIGAIGSMFSDRRLKENIKKIGTADNGLAIYSYNLKGGATTQIGFMADEVEKVIPEAVITHPSGYQMVDYRKAVAHA
jgi:hypothetical protein